MQIGFGRRIILTVSLSLLLSSIAVTLLVGWFVYEYSHRQLFAQQQDISQMVVRRMDNALEQRREALEQLASMLVRDGQLIALQERQKLLDERILLHKYFSGGMVLLDAQGVSITDSPVVPGRLGIDFSDREHVQQVRRTRTTVITHPLIGRGLQTPVFVMNVPVLSTEGELLGFLFGVTRLAEDNLFREIGQETFGQVGNLYVLDQELGLVVTASNTGLAMRPLEHAGLRGLLEQIAQGKLIGVSRDVRGNKVLYAATTMASMDWLVVYTLPERFISEMLYTMLVPLVGVVLILVMLLAFVTWLIIHRPLAELRDTAKVVNAMVLGEIPTRTLNVRSNDEVGTLIGAFNSLEGQLSHHIRELEQRNRDLHRLSEVTAHHLMEPSRRVLVFSERLRTQLAGTIGPEAMVELGFIEQSAQRLRDMVRDMQRYLAAGEAREHTGWHDLGGMLTELLPVLQQRWPQQYAQTRLDIQPMPSVHIDRPRLSDLLQILLDNAFSHAYTGGPLEITVGCESLPESYRYFIDDNGPGVPAQYRERLFAIFERMNNRNSGTGIGLAIARRIVESLGGRIYLDESPSGGTRVCFELPNKVINSS